MKIKSIKVKNFKNFKERTFNFNGQFTLLIGDNGTGKTSILEALCVGLGGFLAGLNDVESRNIMEDEIRKETQLLGDATLITKHQYPVEVSCSALIDNKIIEWKRSKNSRKGNTTRKDAKEIRSYANELQKQIQINNRQDLILPVFAYYSATRMGTQKRNKWTDPFEKEELSRFLGYTDCLDVESNIKLFIRWFKRMSLIKLQTNKKIGELEAVLNAIQTCLKGIGHNTRDVTIRYDFKQDEVIVNLGNEEIPLRLMSAGYRSMIGMVADLAYKMALLNPQLKEQATTETTGVVLIDEIDLHLHPKWQWRIIKDLKHAFPKVHFIATTHAPIVIASCEDQEIIRLYEKHGEIKVDSPKTPTGWLVEDILTDIMDSNDRSPEMKAKIERIENLFRKRLHESLTLEEKSELEALTRYLAIHLPEDDPAVILAKMDAIEAELIGSDESDA